jgi:hypothetical protein
MMQLLVSRVVVLHKFLYRWSLMVVYLIRVVVLVKRVVECVNMLQARAFVMVPDGRRLWPMTIRSVRRGSLTILVQMLMTRHHFGMVLPLDGRGNCHVPMLYTFSTFNK